MAIADGKKIAIRFTQPLVGNVLGLDPPLGYKKSKLDVSDAMVTTRNQYNTSYPGSKAFDGDSSTYWWGTTAINWIQVQLRDAKVVTQLRMYLGSYYIKTFTLSGSNDGTTWTQLGGEYAAANITTAQWYTFEIENSDAYLYYRVDTLTTYSSTVYLYELELYEDVPTGNETKFTVSFDEYSRVPEGSISRVTRAVVGMDKYISINTKLDLSSGRYSGITCSSGLLSLALDEGGD